MKGLKETNFEFPGQTGFYRGKVRDVYFFDKQIVVVATDRISAFDHVLPKPIPYKGQILNQMAAHFLKATEDIVPNWLRTNPDPNVGVGLLAQPIMIEMVVRGYLAGHAAREYAAGRTMICGVEMPGGLKEGDRFPQPIITPATKAEEGHDEDISATEILARKIVTESQWELLCSYALKLFERGSKMARSNGLILVDTKYEFGFVGNEIILIDEIHTADSSRYYILEGYEERQNAGIKQKQLSKEFVREWLMDNGFQGKDGQRMPEMPDAFVEEITSRYIELYEIITGEKFVKREYREINESIKANILKQLF